jgi:hypothetical protein
MFKNSTPIVPGSPFDFAMKQGDKGTSTNTNGSAYGYFAKVKVTTKEKGLEEKAQVFENILQHIVNDHIKLFGFHAEMLKPGITKLGFDSRFEMEVTPVPYEDIFIEEELPDNERRLGSIFG